MLDVLFVVGSVWCLVAATLYGVLYCFWFILMNFLFVQHYAQSDVYALHISIWCSISLSGVRRPFSCATLCRGRLLGVFGRLSACAANVWQIFAKQTDTPLPRIHYTHHTQKRYILCAVADMSDMPSTLELTKPNINTLLDIVCTLWFDKSGKRESIHALVV